MNDTTRIEENEIKLINKKIDNKFKIQRIDEIITQLRKFLSFEYKRRIDEFLNRIEREFENESFF